MKQDLNREADASRFQPSAVEASLDGRAAENALGAPCRLCGASPARTESYMWVISLLVVTRHSEYRDHLCRGCSTRTALEATAKSAVLGWWGIPWGC